MSIKEALVRRNDQDRIEIGEIIDKAMRGKFGDVFYALIEGLRKQELAENRFKPDRFPADRALGRIEGFDIIVDALELAIRDRDELLKPIQDE